MSTRTTNEKRERLLRKLARLDHSDPAATDVDRRIAMLRRDEAVEVDRQMRRVLADDVREKMHRIELDAIAERLRQLKRDDRVYQAAGLSSAVAGNVGVLRLYGSIGGDYQDGISAEMFALALDNLGPVQQISVWVNSPGGNVFDGLSMYNLLRRHPAAVHVKVDGIAASAASIVACAADKGCLTLGAASLLMVHRAWTLTCGNTFDHSKGAEILDTLDRTIAGVYAARSGRPVDFWLAAMSEESWYSADAAIEVGLADGSF